MLDSKTQERARTERLRGWMIKILNDARPDPIELAVLWTALDALDFPLSRRALARELDYLRSVRLIRIFPLGTDDEHTVVDQAKFIQRYANTQSDRELGVSLCAKLSSHGIDFHDGRIVQEGVERIY